MFKFVLRQRRRIGFGTFFITLLIAQQILSRLSQFYAGGVPFFYLSPGLALALFALTTAVILTLFIVILPKWRHLIELLSIFTFFTVALDPIGKVMTLTGLPDRSYAVLLLFLWIAFFSVAYGE